MEKNRQIDKRLLSRILSERLPDADWESFSSIDWESIVQLARAEGVGPLLYRALSGSAQIQRLARALQASLRAMYVSTKLHNEQIIGELKTLAGLFEQAGIPVVVLKGACFALTIYPDLGLRPMADLDLLVPDSQVDSAVRIAKTLGYVGAIPEALPGLNDLVSHAVCLEKKCMPYTTLEVHHTLVAEAGFTHAVPVDWFWSQTEPMKEIAAQGSFHALHMLTPTAEVLYACAHAMLQHGGRNTSLLWLYDLHRLLRAYVAQMDWRLLVSQARIFGWSSAVAAALSQTVLFFDTPVPPGALNELSQQTDRNMERVAAMQDRPATHTLEEYQKLRSLDWYGRFKLILALIAPGPAYMHWRYEIRSPVALPAYYLLRWWGIGRDAVRTVVVLFRRNRNAIKQDKLKSANTGVSS